MKMQFSCILDFFEILQMCMLLHSIKTKARTSLAGRQCLNIITSKHPLNSVPVQNILLPTVTTSSNPSGILLLSSLYFTLACFSLTCFLFLAFTSGTSALTDASSLTLSMVMFWTRCTRPLRPGHEDGLPSINTLPPQVEASKISQSQQSLCRGLLTSDNKTEAPETESKFSTRLS